MKNSIIKEMMRMIIYFLDILYAVVSEEIATRMI